MEETGNLLWFQSCSVLLLLTSSVIPSVCHVQSHQTVSIPPYCAVCNVQSHHTVLFVMCNPIRLCCLSCAIPPDCAVSCETTPKCAVCLVESHQTVLFVMWNQTKLCCLSCGITQNWCGIAPNSCESHETVMWNHTKLS